MNKDTDDTADIYEHFLENTGIKTDDRLFGIELQTNVTDIIVIRWMGVL